MRIGEVFTSPRPRPLGVSSQNVVPSNVTPQWQMTDEAHTFMFADISGYSRLTELDGDEAAAEIALSFLAKASSLAPSHQAEVIKCLGDGVMVHARDAGQTVGLALELLSEWGEDPSLPPIHIGLHTGPALERADDWWGGTVNIAARVAAAADAGQLLLTDATRVAAGVLQETRLRALGRLRFKNIPSPVEVYEASRAGAVSLTAAGC
jgi:adenylate cyclase